MSDAEGGEATGKLTGQGGGGAADRCRSQSWTGAQVQQAGAHPRGVQGWGEGSEQDLHDDLGFTKTTLLLEELKEPQGATPMIIYNDTISPRKHRLTPESKKNK